MDRDEMAAVMRTRFRERKRPKEKKASNARASKRPPIHEAPTPANPQSKSPLYNGRIPPEIRNHIFSYALSEYTKSDVESTFYHDTHYTRPGYTGAKTIHTALLRVCRQTYLETYQLPFVLKEHVFYHQDSKRRPPVRGRRLEEHEYLQYFLPWQLALIKEIHIFSQLFWLEADLFQVAQRDFMQGIEIVKVTIRRGDWWWWEDNEPLAISPQSGVSTESKMRLQWELEAKGHQTPWNREAWGYAFAHMRSLKELDMEFETTDDKKHELEAIVKKARGWQFPAFSTDGEAGKVLSATNLEPKWSTWQGPFCYWAEQCPYCRQPYDEDACVATDPPNPGCTERARLRWEYEGPICHVVNLKWKACKQA